MVNTKVEVQNIPDTPDTDPKPFTWIFRPSSHGSGSWRLDTPLIPVAVHLGRWNNPDKHQGDWAVVIGADRIFLSSDSTLEAAQDYAVNRLTAMMRIEIARLKRLLHS